MRWNALLLALALCVPAAAQDAGDQQKSERLGLARHLTAPTAYYSSIRSRDIIAAVKASKFWQRPLIRQGLDLIPEEAEAIIARILETTSDEFGLWIPQTSAEPFARLLSLLPDAASAALGWFGDEMAPFERNARRQRRIVDALEKGIIPTFVLFNRTAQAEALAEEALKILDKKGPLGPGLKYERKQAGKTSLGILRFQVRQLLPGSVNEMLKGLPLARMLGDEDRARLARAIESWEIVAAFGRVGDYLVLSMGPDASALAGIAKNLAEPPPAEKTLAASPMLAASLADMTDRTVSITTGDARAFRAALTREVTPAVRDLQADIHAHKQRGLFAGPAGMALPQAELLLEALLSSLQTPDETNGLRQAVMVLDRGLRSIDRLGLNHPGKIVKGGGKLARLMPKETLASGISFLDKEEQAASIEEAIGTLQALQGYLAGYVWVLGTDPAEVKKAEALFDGLSGVLRKFGTQVVPTLGQWNGFVVTASGQLEVPDEFTVKIPEFALIVQVKDSDAIAAWWKASAKTMAGLLDKLVEDEEIELPKTTAWTHRDVAIHGYDLPTITGKFKGDFVLNACIVNGHLIASSSLRLTKRIVDLAKGKADGEDIAARPRFQAMADQLFSRAAFDYQVFVDLGGWVDYARHVTLVVLKQDARGGKVAKDDQELVDNIFDLLKILGALGETSGVSGTTRTTRTWIMFEDE